MSKKSLKSLLLLLGMAVCFLIVDSSMSLSQVVISSLLVLIEIGYSIVDRNSGDLLPSKCRAKDTLHPEFWVQILQETDFKEFIKQKFSIGGSLNNEFGAKVKHEENDTYQLIPNEVNEEFWSVRILKGMFNETVIRYGNIAFNEVAEGVMSFNFTVESSPDSTITEENEVLQEVAGDILQELLQTH